MKSRQKIPPDCHPMMGEDLVALWNKNPTPELRLALWEIWRLKEFIRERYANVRHLDVLYFQGKPGCLSDIKQQFREEVNEAWPKRPAAGAAFTPGQGLPKGHKFADLDDEHPEDAYLRRHWPNIAGGAR